MSAVQPKRTTRWQGPVFVSTVCEQGASGTTVREQRKFLAVVTVSKSTTVTETSATPVGSRFELERVRTRVHRRTTLRGGRVAEDTLQESEVVQDHLGRVHSARRARHKHGKLEWEVAALYLPSSHVSRPAGPGFLAVSAIAGSNGLPPAALAPGSGGAVAAAATAGGAAVAAGYIYVDGHVAYGVLSSPEEYGLPRQRPVTPEALQRVRPPPWQQSAAAAAAAAPTRPDYS